jgi:hypothetical protein
MEYHSWHALSFLYQGINAPQERIRRYIVAILDISAHPVVVTNIHDDVVLTGDLVALYDLCKSLMIPQRTTR